MQRIQDDRNAGAAVNPERVVKAVAPVVVLQHQAPAHHLRQCQEARRKARAAGNGIAVHAPHMHHDHGVALQPHGIQQHSRRGQFLTSAAHLPLFRRVELDVVRGMQCHAQPVVTHEIARRRQVGGTLIDLAVKRGQPGMGQVGRQLPGKAVEANLPAVEIAENILQIGQADTEMGLILPAPAVM